MGSEEVGGKPVRQARRPLITKKGAEIRVINSTPTHVYLLIYVQDSEGDWHQLKAKVGRDKFKTI